MKQHAFLFFCLLVSLGAILSCQKDDSPPVEESPFFVFFDQPAIEIDTTPQSANTWEYGFVFNPLADGKITELGLKLPVTGQFKVRLWDLSGSAPTVLSEQQIASTSAHEPAFAAIPALAVKKDAALGVTVLANSFYRLQKKDASEFTFPQVAGHIRIVSFNEHTNDIGTANFPTMANPLRVAPCVNVVFIAD